MKFSTEKPPVYEKCRERFGVDWERGIIMTYGDTIHCKFPISDDLVAHEQTHIAQQEKIGKELWWEKYLEDRAFRLFQEVEAYRNQWKYIQENYNHKARKYMFKNIVSDMARLYGNMCTKEEAEQLLS